MPKEPQSYGSQSDWVTGQTKQKVNDSQSVPSTGQSDFYDESRESEHSAPHQGGDVSPIQLAENRPTSGPETGGARTVVKGVTDQEKGAKRGGFFKRRDYGG